MKQYKFNKNINGIKFKFDLDLRPHVIALFIGEMTLLVLVNVTLFKIF